MSEQASAIPGFKPNDYDRFGLQFNFDPNAPASLAESDLINAAYLPVTALPYGWNALLAARNILALGGALELIGEWKPVDFGKFGPIPVTVLLASAAALLSGAIDCNGRIGCARALTVIGLASLSWIIARTRG